MNHGVTLKHLEQIFVWILFISATGCSAQSWNVIVVILNGIGIVIGIVTIIVVYLTSRRALTAQWVQTRSSRDEGRTSIGQYLGFRL